MVNRLKSRRTRETYRGHTTRFQNRANRQSTPVGHRLSGPRIRQLTLEEETIEVSEIEADEYYQQQPTSAIQTKNGSKEIGVGDSPKSQQPRSPK